MSRSTSGFVAIPTHVMRNGDLSPGARCVFGVILSYAWGGNACTASNKTLCADAGISQSGLYEAIRTLKAAGLVKVERGTNARRRKLVVVPTGGLEVEGNEGEFASDSGFWNPSTEVDVGQGQVEEDSLRSSSRAARGERAKELTAEPSVAHLCGLLSKLMQDLDPKAKTAPRSIGWLSAAEKLMRIDERHFEEVVEVLKWTMADDFWQARILSMPKFREKYPTLRGQWLKSKRPKPGSYLTSAAAAQPVPSSADLAAAFARNGEPDSDLRRRTGSR